MSENASSALALILAGGEGAGLGVLTAQRSDSALPFAGKYRIVDFVLSNCVNSGITNVAVLTQYQPRSLNDHIGIGKPWDLDRARGGVRLLQPYQRQRGAPGSWQEGTADAVRFNLDHIAEQDVEYVLVLAGDHVYCMDYSPLVAEHVARQADVTIAVRPVSNLHAHRFGMIAADAQGMVTQFEEKPERTRSTLASMGIYVFGREALIGLLTGEAAHMHDFGRELIPSLVGRARLATHTFVGYWDDIGTAQSYYDAHMQLLAETPALDLYDPNWIIHTRSEERPAALIGAAASVEGNLLCDGCRVDGSVSQSVVGPGVYIAPGAVVRRSVIMNDAQIGAGAILEGVVCDKQACIGEGAHIGGDAFANVPNRTAPQRLSSGLTLIGKRARVPAGALVGRNVEIAPEIPESAFPRSGLPSGASLP